MKQDITIMFTGGHITPAIAVIEEIKKRHKNWHIVCIGRDTVFESMPVPSEEPRLMERMGVDFLPLVTGRIRREMSVSAFFSLCKVPIGFAQAFWYCLMKKPTVIVSFGSYVGVPVVLAGWCLRVPIIAHEQSRGIGLSNKISARLANRIGITFPESQTYFPKEKVVYTGLPLRKILFNPPAFPGASIPLDRKIIYISGGSTGSDSLNTLSTQVVSSLLDTYTVVHQTGRFTFEHMNAYRNTLSDIRRKRYYIFPYIDEELLSWIYRHASLVIARSGVNTVVELASLGKMSILIPLPWSADNEQQVNADWLGGAGGAKVLDQQTVTPQQLVAAVDDMMEHNALYIKRAKEFSRTLWRDGSRRLVDMIEGAVQ